MSQDSGFMVNNFWTDIVGIDSMYICMYVYTVCMYTYVGKEIIPTCRSDDGYIKQNPLQLIGSRCRWNGLRQVTLKQQLEVACKE